MSHFPVLPMRVLWQNVRQQGSMGETHAETHWRARHRDSGVQKDRVQEVAGTQVNRNSIGLRTP